MMFAVFGVFLLVVILLVCTVMFIGGLFSTEKKSKRPVKNYKVHFEPANNKYFIVNELPTKDVPVTGFFGFKVYYKDQVTADFVKQKLNGE